MITYGEEDDMQAAIEECIDEAERTYNADLDFASLCAAEGAHYDVMSYEEHLREAYQARRLGFLVLEWSDL